MKKSELATFVAGIDMLINQNQAKRDVEIKISAFIDGVLLTIYKQSVDADSLQTSGFGAFRSEVNDITTYYKGRDISGKDCVLTIGDHTFNFVGGKFSNNINTLLNSVVVRGGMLGHKKEAKKLQKEAIMNQLLPKGSNLLQYIELSAHLDKYENSQIRQGASIIEIDGDGALILPTFEEPSQIESTNE